MGARAEPGVYVSPGERREPREREPRHSPDSEVEEVRWISSNIPNNTEVGSIFAHDVLPKLKAQGLVLDVAARTVAASGKRVSLTRKEFDLLTTFLRKPRRVLSIPFLLERVWGYDPADYSDPHTIGVHVSTLRRKIGPKLGARIISVPGLGYRCEP